MIILAVKLKIPNTHFPGSFIFIDLSDTDIIMLALRLDSEKKRWWYILFYNNLCVGGGGGSVRMFPKISSSKFFQPVATSLKIALKNKTFLLSQWKLLPKPFHCFCFVNYGSVRTCIVSQKFIEPIYGIQLSHIFEISIISN